MVMVLVGPRMEARYMLSIAYMLTTYVYLNRLLSMQKYCYYHECESFNACVRSVIEMLNFEFWKFIFVNLKDVLI